MKKIIVLLLTLSLTWLSACSNNSGKVNTSATSDLLIESISKNEVSYSTVEVMDLISEQYQIEEEIQAEYKAGGYTLEEPLVVQDPYGVAPLSALVCFETEYPTTVKVTVKGKDSYSDITHTYQTEETSHTIPIYGLYGGVENTVLIELGSGKSSELTLVTDPLPEKCKPAEVIVNKLTDGIDGLTFTTPTSGGGQYVIGYDINGDVRFYMSDTFAAGYEITRIENGHIVLASGRIAAQPYYGTGIMEINALGKIYKEYDISGAFHHDFKYLDNGNILLCSEVTSSGFVEDAVVEIESETGKLVRVIDLKDIIPYKEAHSLNWSERDWFHNNSIDYDAKNNAIILSGRHIDGVISIDYETAELNWILGSPDGWGDEWKKYFFTPKGKPFEWSWAQHSARVNPDGSIFIFDNGNNKSKNKESAVSGGKEYSRGVIYGINTEDMSITQNWEFGKERGTDFYSMYISEVTYLEPGHYIVHSGGIVKNADGSPGMNPFAEGAVQSTTIVEIIMPDPSATTASEADVVYELKVPANTFRSERMSLYDFNENYQLCERGSLLGQLDYTELTKDEITVPDTAESMANDNRTPNILEEIMVNNETDRIVVSAALTEPKEGIKVYIILKAVSEELEDRVYDTSSNKIYKQIAKNGIIGNYAIWIQINDRVVDTGEQIHFIDEN